MKKVLEQKSSSEFPNKNWSLSSLKKLLTEDWSNPQCCGSQTRKW